MLTPTWSQVGCAAPTAALDAGRARNALPTRFDGPPRVVGLVSSFLVAVWSARRICWRCCFDKLEQANDIANYMRRLGPFEPHRLNLDEMEYTTMPFVMDKLKERFRPIIE